jgi:alanyl aminopeptidase
MSVPAHRRLPVLFALVLSLACAGTDGRSPLGAPLGRLPRDVHPTHYHLELAIDPERERFSGTARIDVVLAAATEVIWLHGKRLTVGEASVRVGGGAPLPARWQPADASGVAALVLPRRIGPGAAELHITWDSAFGERGRGLYRVEAGGDAYAFTHFEPIAARLAFPGFDEPAFKTPFDVELLVREDHVAVGNTPVVREEPADRGVKRVRFATTAPLPTYLLAWAVGPLDVVTTAPIPAGAVRRQAVPFRGVAARGRGPELATALAETPALLAALESYFGSAYPYAKLDVVAVPQFGAGAMENVGAVFFREELLMLDGPRVTEQQRRGFGYVMAHELAHQWFGNLVTMPWWNDIWLNEAFATWLGRRIEAEIFPQNEAEASLLAGVHRAMDQDALTTARSVRQPIDDQHDIHNAFDAITYDKGGGVLAMFERWLGRDVFRAGIERYLAEHRMATASSEDLLTALSQAAGRDVAAPFGSFLTQPGVPLIEAAGACDAGGGIRVRQSRYLPLGSTGDRDGSWQIPICVRYGVGDAVRESCSLLDEREARIDLGDACPDWFMPNADAAGYYRFALAAGDARKLREKGWRHLSARERHSVADNLEVAFRAGAIAAPEAFDGLDVLAADADRRVAHAPISLLRFAREHLVSAAERPRVERFASALYAARFARLGWDATPGEGGEVKLERRALTDFLTEHARDPEVRREAELRGRRFAGLDGEPRDLAALEPELVEAALSVVIEAGDADDFAALWALFRATEDPTERRDLLRALGASRAPELARRARALALDPALLPGEVWSPLYRQSRFDETRDASWRFVEEHFDELVARAGSNHSGWMPWLAAGFCDEARAAEVATFLGPRIDAIEGGPRQLAGSLEAIQLCAAMVAEQGPATARFFAEAP